MVKVKNTFDGEKNRNQLTYTMGCEKEKELYLRYHISEESLKQFQQNISRYTRLYDLNYYLKIFRRLPDFKNYQLNETPEIISNAAQHFLKKIDLYYAKWPSAALIVVMFCFCDDRVTFFNNHRLRDEFIHRIKLWLANQPLSHEEHLNFCLDLYTYWPISGKDCDRTALFAETITRLFVEYVKVSPDCALTLFEANFLTDQLFFFSFDDREKFLQFIEPVKEQRPQQYYESLIICSDDEIRYALLMDHNVHQYIDREKLAQRLIKCGPKDKSWYASLPSLLWQLEQSKSAPDAQSLKNCMLVVLNNLEDATNFNKIFNYVKVLSQNNDFLTHELTHKASLEIIEDFSGGYFSHYKNTSELAHKTEEEILQVDDKRFTKPLLKIYLEIMKGLYQHNPRIYFYALIALITWCTNSISDQPLKAQKIRDRAKKIFIKHFEWIYSDYYDDIIKFFDLLVYSAMLTPKYAWQVLDELFVLVCIKDKNLAFEIFERYKEPRTNPFVGGSTWKAEL